MAEQTNDSNTPAPSSKGLTVDEMLKKYPKKNVERALFNADYVDTRNRSIKTYKDTIARGINVELATRALRKYLEETPSEPPIDPGEPADLDPDVLWRIKVMKYIYRDRPIVRPATILDLDYNSVHPDDAVNHDAILNAYRRGELKVVPGVVTVWYAGNLVLGPLPKGELTIEYMIHMNSEWRKKYGPGRVWEECPTRRFPQHRG